MQDFRNLKIWEKAHNLSLEVYNITDKLPKSEDFGLKSQMRRAAVSITSNVAEGCGRNSINEFAKFISYSIGSAFELESQIELIKDLNYLNSVSDYPKLISDLEELKKMLYAFQNKLKQ